MRNICICWVRALYAYRAARCFSWLSCVVFRVWMLFVTRRESDLGGKNMYTQRVGKLINCVYGVWPNVNWMQYMRIL